MLNDTIIAISSPLGNSLRGIIRISGPRAFEAVRKFLKSSGNFPPKSAGWKVLTGCLSIKSSLPSHPEIIVPVSVFLMPGPNSYTRENLAEIHTIGNRILLEEILRHFIRFSGCDIRLAEPGEFTKRAFLSGRINISQAEAVLNIIHSSSEKEHQLAVNQLYQYSSGHLKEIIERLFDIVSRVELSIDFSDQDIDIISNSSLSGLVGSITKEIKSILDAGRKSRSLFKEGVVCVLCGRANVGKSSLFNRLVSHKANIVSPISGTTRDYIEGSYSFRGRVFRVFDTAGIIDRPLDILSRKSRQKTGQILSRADIYIMVADSLRLNHHDRKILAGLNPDSTILVYNKSDLADKRPDGDIRALHAGQIPSLFASALTGYGVSRLKRAVYQLSNAKPPGRSADDMYINLRQQGNLAKVLESLGKAKSGIRRQISYEFIVADLKQALEYLNLALGSFTSGQHLVADDVLNHIFSRFCIGK